MMQFVCAQLGTSPLEVRMEKFQLQVPMVQQTIEEAVTLRNRNCKMGSQPLEQTRIAANRNQWIDGLKPWNIQQRSQRLMEI